MLRQRLLGRIPQSHRTPIHNSWTDIQGRVHGHRLGSVPFLFPLQCRDMLRCTAQRSAGILSFQNPAMSELNYAHGFRIPASERRQFFLSLRLPNEVARKELVLNRQSRRKCLANVSLRYSRTYTYLRISVNVDKYLQHPRTRGIER